MATSTNMIDLEQVAKKAANQLQEMYQISLNHGLIFPTHYYNKEPYDEYLRISEQEARICFLMALQVEISQYNLGLSYTIETPTNLKYSEFSGKGAKPKVHIPGTYVPPPKGGPSAGMIDVSIYFNPEIGDIKIGGLSIKSTMSHINQFIWKLGQDTHYRIPKINMEFKFGPASDLSYKKDLLKLYSEEAVGMWFHLYEDKDGTQSNIIDKFQDNYIYVRDIVNAKRNEQNYSSEVRLLDMRKEIIVFLVGLQKSSVPAKLDTYKLDTTGKMQKLP